MTAEGSVEKLRTESQKDIISVYLLKALNRISPAAPAVLGIDGFEAGPEEIILKIASLFTKTLQSYLYICYVLRVAAEMMYVDGLNNRVTELLRLQELIRL
jgi:hypothetical protein